MNAQLLSQTRFGNFIGLLLLAAFVLACGGSPSASEDKKDVTQEPSSSQLSFGEYLAVCAVPASLSAIDEEPTLKEFATALGAFTERLEAVEPPEEVTDWHNAVLVYQRALKMELDDGPGEGESEEQYIFSTVLTLVIEHQPDISASIMAMNGEILARMIEAGCIDEDVLGLGGGDGQASPPEGEFTSVSAGRNHTCGVKIDGSVAWLGRGLERRDLTPRRRIFLRQRRDASYVRSED